MRLLAFIFAAILLALRCLAQDASTGAIRGIVLDRPAKAFQARRLHWRMMRLGFIMSRRPTRLDALRSNCLRRENTQRAWQQTKCLRRLARIFGWRSAEWRKLTSVY